MAVFTLARVLARNVFTPYAAYAGLHTSLMLREKSAYGFFVDNRRYDDGWRLEKYVEAGVDPNAGVTAAWWLELGWADDAWLVSSNVNVSHTDIHIELPVGRAKDAAQLRTVLDDTISQLIRMAHEDNPFAVAIGETLKD